MIQGLFAHAFMHHAGRIAPGIEGVWESFSEATQITDDAVTTTTTLEFTYEGDYTEDPALLPSAYVATGTSVVATKATAEITSVDHSTKKVVVQANLNAAPGSGKNVDVTLCLWVAGQGPSR